MTGPHSDHCKAMGLVEIWCPQVVPCNGCPHYGREPNPERAMLTMAGILYPEAETMKNAKAIALRWREEWHLDNAYAKRYLAELGLL